jgi:hypothetical protein
MKRGSDHPLSYVPCVNHASLAETRKVLRRARWAGEGDVYREPEDMCGVAYGADPGSLVRPGPEEGWPWQ